MRRDLLAAREKNGVYMAQENYEQITREIELQRKEIVEKLEQIKAMEEEQTRKEESCQQLQGLYDEQQTVLHVWKTKQTLILCCIDSFSLKKNLIDIRPRRRSSTALNTISR